MTAFVKLSVMSFFKVAGVEKCCVIQATEQSAIYKWQSVYGKLLALRYIIKHDMSIQGSLSTIEY